MELLDEAVQLYVVERKAEFAGSAKIAEELFTLFKVKVAPQNLTIYDPETETGEEKLSPKLKAHFHAHRKRFLEDRSRIGLSHANYRLSLLQGLIDHPLYGQNPEMVKSIVEMSEKIEGGMYQARVSPSEIIEDFRERGDAVTKAIRTTVTDAKEADRAIDKVKKILDPTQPRSD